MMNLLPGKVAARTAAGALALALLVVACATPPVEEMDNATEAVNRAENDPNAVQYSPDILDVARRALAAMRQEADARRFDAAKNHAAEAIAAAEQAISEGRAAAERSRNDAQTLVSELPPMIDETDRGINRAKAAPLALDFNPVDRDFAGARDNARLAQEAFDTGLFSDTLTWGRAARDMLADINQRISSAAVAVSSGKK